MGHIRLGTLAATRRWKDVIGLIAGIKELAERVLQKPAEMGHACGITSMSQALDEPEFATAIGLVRYGALRERRTAAPVSWRDRLKAWWGWLIGVVKTLKN